MEDERRLSNRRGDAPRRGSWSWGTIALISDLCDARGDGRLAIVGAWGQESSRRGAMASVPRVGRRHHRARSLTGRRVVGHTSDGAAGGQGAPSMAPGQGAPSAANALTVGACAVWLCGCRAFSRGGKPLVQGQRASLGSATGLCIADTNTVAWRMVSVKLLAPVSGSVCCRTGSAGGPPASVAATRIGAPTVVGASRAPARALHEAGGPPALPVVCCSALGPAPDRDVYPRRWRAL